jgi:hypothetical protein
VHAYKSHLHLHLRSQMPKKNPRAHNSNSQPQAHQLAKKIARTCFFKSGRSYTGYLTIAL